MSMQYCRDHAGSKTWRWLRGLSIDMSYDFRRWRKHQKACLDRISRYVRRQGGREGRRGGGCARSSQRSIRSFAFVVSPLRWEGEGASLVGRLASCVGSHPVRFFIVATLAAPCNLCRQMVLLDDILCTGFGMASGWETVLGMCSGQMSRNARSGLHEVDSDSRRAAMKARSAQQSAQTSVCKREAFRNLMLWSPANIVAADNIRRR